MLKFNLGNVDYSTYTTSLQLLEIRAKTDYSALYSIYILLFKVKNLITSIKDKLTPEFKPKTDPNTDPNPNPHRYITDLEQREQLFNNSNLESYLEKLKEVLLNQFSKFPNINTTDDIDIEPLFNYLQDNSKSFIEKYIHSKPADSKYENTINLNIKSTIDCIRKILNNQTSVRDKIEDCKKIAQYLLSKQFNFDELNCFKDDFKDKITGDTFNLKYKEASQIARESDEELKKILNFFKGDKIIIEYINKEPILRAYKETLASIDTWRYIEAADKCINKKVRIFLTGSDFLHDTLSGRAGGGGDGDEDVGGEDDGKRGEDDEKEDSKKIKREEADRAAKEAAKADETDKIEELLRQIGDKLEEIIKEKNIAEIKIKSAIGETKNLEMRKKEGNISKTEEEHIKTLISECRVQTALVKQNENDINILIKKIMDKINSIDQITSTSGPLKTQDSNKISDKIGNIFSSSKKMYESSKISESFKHSTDELFMSNYLKKIKSGQQVTSSEVTRYNELKAHYETNADSIQNEKIREKIKKNLETDITQIDINKIDGFILNFQLVAKIFRTILLIITSLCIVMYIFVLLLSIFNVFNLILQIILSITSIFYNKKTSNNEILSYKVKDILKCTKDNYKYDILNVLNEQMAAVSIFNLTLYIVYLLLFYCIIYIIYVVISSVPLSKDKKYTLVGTINDIDDPQFSLLGVTAAIFLFSIIHLFYYKFLFKSISYKQYKDINGYEVNIDNLIKNVVKTNTDTFDVSFFSILKDSSKRKQIDDKILNEIADLNASNTNTNNLYAYLLIYDIYIYLEHNTHLNDVKKAEVQNYFDKIMQGSAPDKTFISFLDTNERKLIKPYHEDLPFYKNIPQDKVEFYDPINENIATTLSSINKNIISYSGTFNAFLFTCIYIITICIYNFICVYFIMTLIKKAGEGVFHQYIVFMAQIYVKYMDMFIEYISSKLFKQQK